MFDGKDLEKLIDKIKSESTRIKKNEEQEFEIRLFDEKNGTSKQLYDELLGKMNNLSEIRREKPITSKTTVHIYEGGYRKIVDRINSTEICQQKDKKGHVDKTFQLYSRELKIRFSYNVEKTVDKCPTKVIMTRTRERTEFRGKTGTHYTYVFTKVHEQTDKDVVDKYEVEIEFTGSDLNYLNIDMIKKELDIVPFERHLSLEDVYSSYLADLKKFTPYLKNGYPKIPQPINLKEKHMSTLRKQKYQVTNKLDGKRFLVYFMDGGMYSIQNEKVAYLGKTVVKRALIDTEFFKGTYYVFDCYFDGISVFDMFLTRRLEYAKKIAESNPLFVMKTFKSNLFGATMDFLQYDQKDNDGLIYTPEDPSASDIYKWKFIDKLTIDFRLIKTDKTINFRAVQTSPTEYKWYVRSAQKEVPFKVDGREFIITGKLVNKSVYRCEYDKTLQTFVDVRKESDQSNPDDVERATEIWNYLKNPGVSGYKLYVGSEKTEVPFKVAGREFFLESEDVVNKGIYECKYDKAIQNFVIDRPREDKTKPNYITIAKDVWEDIQHPVTPTQLLEIFESLKYYRKYHNEIKRQLITAYCKGKSVLDLGVGRGGDLMKYQDAKAMKIVGVEPFATNYEELETRFSNNKDFKIPFQLLKTKAENTEEIMADGQTFDIVSSFFSLSFFFFTQSILDQLLTTISLALKDGGYFIGTTIDGGRTEALLKSGPFHFGDGTISMKDRIVTLEMPGTIVKTQVESLVDFDLLTDKLKAVGIELVSSSFFASSKTLTKEENVLNSLYRQFVFRKVIKVLVSRKKLDECFKVPNVKDYSSVELKEYVRYFLDPKADFFMDTIDIRLYRDNSEPKAVYVALELEKKLMASKLSIDAFHQHKTEKERFYGYLTSQFDGFKRYLRTMDRQYTNAWLKCWEMVHYYQLIPYNHEDFTVFCNAELPGAFIFAIDQYMSTTGNKKYNWYANSLWPSNSEILSDSFGLYAKYKYNWLMTPENGGSATDPKMIEIIAQKLGGKVDLYTSDIGIGISSEDANKQETLEAHLNLGQIVCALKSLKKGGHMIVKTFMFFKPMTMSLLYLLTYVFKEFSICKPMTSRPGNSEIYLVGKYYEEDVGITRQLEYLLYSWDEKKMDDWIVPIPQSFYCKLIFASYYIYERQIHFIDKNVELAKREYAHKKDREVTSEIKLRDRIVTNWLNKYPITGQGSLSTKVPPRADVRTDIPKVVDAVQVTGFIAPPPPKLSNPQNVTLHPSIMTQTEALERIRARIAASARP